MVFSDSLRENTGSTTGTFTCDISDQKSGPEQKAAKWTHLVNTRAIFPGPPSPRFESLTDLLCRAAARRVRQQPQRGQERSIPTHSALSVTAGSTFAARRAGSQQASAATPSITTAT